MALGGWSRGRVLGRGSTATVSLGSTAGSTDLFAVKSAELAHSSSLQREQRILSSLNCKHVVSYLGYDISADTYNLFLEYAPAGSLSDEIAKHGGGLREPAIRSRARDILVGLSYLHSRSIVHCDVKSQNVLIGSDGRTVIADLGCAKYLDEDCAALRGTPMFMAPEVARGESQGPEADVWAVGCIAIEMATGRAPWPDASGSIAVLHRIAFSESVPESPKWMSEEGKDFLSRCLCRDPHGRWTADQLLQHPFLVNCANSDSEHKWTSPKSVLDQSIWEGLEEEEADSDGDDTPQRVIANLISCGPNWTWGEHWLTVRTEDADYDINEGQAQEDIATTVTVGTTGTNDGREYQVSDMDVLRSGYGTEDGSGVGIHVLDYRANCDLVNSDPQFSNKNLLMPNVLHVVQLLDLISILSYAAFVRSKYPGLLFYSTVQFSHLHVFGISIIGILDGKPISLE